MKENVDGVSLYGGFREIGSSDKAIQTRPLAKFDNSNYWSLHVITGHGLTSDIIIDGFRIEKGNDETKST